MLLRNKKTGQIGELSGVNRIVVYEPNRSQLCGNLRPCTILGEYDTLAELCTECEDYYEPKDPLIKDEKIRKAVRAWAEVNAIRQVAYAHDSSSCRLTDVREENYCIEFKGWILTLKYSGAYTIAELCGEE